MLQGILAGGFDHLLDKRGELLSRGNFQRGLRTQDVYPLRPPSRSARRNETFLLLKSIGSAVGLDALVKMIEAMRELAEK